MRDIYDEKKERERCMKDKRYRETSSVVCMGRERGETERESSSLSDTFI